MKLSFKLNRRTGWLLAILLSVILLGCSGVVKLRILATIDGRSQLISTTRQFTEKETAQARRSLELIQQVDPAQQYPGGEQIKLYWMRSSEYGGMTVYLHKKPSIILINENLRLGYFARARDYFELGCIYAHELSHAVDGTNDPETGRITDEKLNIMIITNRGIFKKWKP